MTSDSSGRENAASTENPHDIKVPLPVEQLGKLHEGAQVRLDLGDFSVRARVQAGHLVRMEEEPPEVLSTPLRKVDAFLQDGRLHRSVSTRAKRHGTKLGLRDALVRKLRVLIANTPENVIFQALSENDFGTIITLANEETLGRELTGVEKARLRGIRYREELLERAGGTMTVEEVSELLEVSQEAVRRPIRENRLIAFRKARGYTLPAIQFDQGREIEGLRRVLGAMRVVDPWTRLDWLINSEPRLEGRRPIDVLRAGEDIDQVVMAAELVGVHGAA